MTRETIFGHKYSRLADSQGARFWRNFTYVLTLTRKKEKKKWKQMFSEIKTTRAGRRNDETIYGDSLTTGSLW